MQTAIAIRLPDWRHVLTQILGLLICVSLTLQGIAYVRDMPAPPIVLRADRVDIYDLALSLGMPWAMERHACGLVKYGVNSATDWMGRPYKAVNCDRQETRNFIFWRMYGPEFVKIAAPIYFLVYYTNMAQAAPHHGGTPFFAPNCSKPINSLDGCTGAQSNGSSGVNPNVLTQYNGGTPYSNPYPNNAPVRDYPVGYDPTLPLTNAALYLPPASYHCSLGGGNSWFCNFAAATCANLCAISNVDFNDYRLVPTGPQTATNQTWIITNNRFRNGPTIALQNGGLISFGGNHFNLSIKYNEFDGNSHNYGFVAGISDALTGTSSGTLITKDIQYNDFHDMPARAMNSSATYSVKNVNWNAGRHLDDDYVASQHVTVDSVANTIEFIGPLYNAGSKLIHAAQGGTSDCRRFNTGVFNGGVTAFSGAIGAQISGTPGGLGKYTFTGATGNLTDVTIDCGSSLHGEFDGMGISANTVATEMNYVGNLIAYGSDCAPLNTGLLVFLATNGFYTKIGKSLVSNNVMINRISGDGTWGGCAAHTWSNNAPVGYDDLTIQYNWLDTLAVGTPGNSTVTGCFYNPAGQGFVGSQTADVLTVTSTSPIGPIPTGVQIRQSTTNFGIITGQISVDPSTGAGTYSMSDSRTQSFSAGGENYAPNQANSGGAIPYAPTFPATNVNMADGNVFSVTTASMNTSVVACHG